MSQHAVFYEHNLAAADQLPQKDPSHALEYAREALKKDPENISLLEMLLHAAIAEGVVGLVQQTRERLFALPKTAKSLKAIFDGAIALGDLRAARQALAEAEANSLFPERDLPALKAVIAHAEGDTQAATAILVMAVERFPDAAILRRHLTETLVASGNAANAKAVLGHIAQPPVNPRPVDTGNQSAPEMPQHAPISA